MTRIGLALSLFLAACASTPPERAYYLLRSEVTEEPAAAAPGAAIGMGRVLVAPYLDRTGIMVQVDEHRIREARFHLWAEPLDEGIWYYLHEQISSRLDSALATGPSADSWRYRVDISVEEFHGTLDGASRLTVRWSLRDISDGAVIETRSFTRERPQVGDGYTALVDTQTALLDELAETIARSLRTLDPGT